MVKQVLLHLFFSLSTIVLYGQINIEGYLFESGNRGFIEGAEVILSNEQESEIYAKAISDSEGKYRFTVIQPGRYMIIVSKPPFIDYKEEVIIDRETEQKFLKHEIARSPGYAFEITLAEKLEDGQAPKKAINGALIEVYNNTLKQEHLVIPNLETPDFKVDLIKGNHYTILIRKQGYLSKRMEAYVDVKGCILCFEGVGEITPGVSDNLTESNTMGTLLANVELDPYYMGKVIEMNDILYQFGKATLTNEAKKELDLVASFIKDNPNLSLELGAHTDSKGTAAFNLDLSKRRAQSAVGYLINEKDVPPVLLTFKGYGETQLKNDCDDRSNCSEEEHALNRRTELKILDIGNTAEFRSLRQIKTDELLDEILSELNEEGQVKIPEEEVEKRVSATADKDSIELVVDDFEMGSLEKPSKISEENVELTESHSAPSAVV